MNKDEIARLIADHGIETVKIGTPDMDGVYRGKRVSAKQFLDGCDGAGFAQCDVIFGWDIAEEIITGAQLAIGSADTGFADVLLRPTSRPSASSRGSPRRRRRLRRLRRARRPRSPISPRSVLRRVVDRARAARLRAA